ncbi:MAG: hypothetical protein SFZ03_09145 [Candidatus Melainabacteria bacterium]|nr:hypothetical protein [Candidatus Melainabacteria bacterium]
MPVFRGGAGPVVGALVVIGSLERLFHLMESLLARLGLQAHWLKASAALANKIPMSPIDWLRWLFTALLLLYGVEWVVTNLVAFCLFGFSPLRVTLAAVPQPWAATAGELLADVTPATQTVTCGQYRLTLPDGYPRRTLLRPDPLYHASCLFQYPDGRRLVFTHYGPEMMRRLQLGAQNPIPEWLLGHDLKTPYRVFHTVMRTQTGELYQLFLWPGERTRLLFRLLFKSALLPQQTASVHLYEFHWRGLDGFQVGRAEQGEPITIDVFDDSGQWLCVQLVRSVDEAPHFSQSALVRLLHSLNRYQTTP